MRQYMIKYECDGCHKIVEEAQNTSVPRGRMPKDWLRVDGFSNSHSVFKIDLCEVCKKDIMKYTDSA